MRNCRLNGVPYRRPYVKSTIARMASCLRVKRTGSEGVGSGWYMNEPTAYVGRAERTVKRNAFCGLSCVGLVSCPARVVDTRLVFVSHALRTYTPTDDLPVLQNESCGDQGHVEMHVFVSRSDTSRRRSRRRGGVVPHVLQCMGECCWTVASGYILRQCWEVGTRRANARKASSAKPKRCHVASTNTVNLETSLITPLQSCIALPSNQHGLRCHDQSHVSQSKLEYAHHRCRELAATEHRFHRLIPLLDS
jgi:hypothetical protein